MTEEGRVQISQKLDTVKMKTLQSSGRDEFRGNGPGAGVGGLPSKDGD